MKKYFLTLNQNKFSEIIFPVRLYIKNKNTILSIIKVLYSALTKISEGNKAVYIIMKYKYADGSIRSIHSAIGINLDKMFVREYFAYIKSILDGKSNNYDIDTTSNPIRYVIFNFFFIPKGSEVNYSSIESMKNQRSLEKVVHNFSVNEAHYYLPLDRDYSSWGKTLNDSDSKLIVQVEFKGIFGIIEVDKYAKNISNSYQGTTINFSDNKFKRNLFIREFEKGTKFYIDENAAKMVLKIKPIETKFLEPIEPSFSPVNKIATLDIETVVKDNIHHPYLFAFYDGYNKFTWFENNADSLFKHILSSKYSGYTIYAHNLSRFDVVFLFKTIAHLKNQGYKVKIIKKDDKFISIRIIDKNKNVSITLKDSYLILPLSLAKLSKQFNLEVGKLIEPVYVGKSNDKLKSDSLDHYTKKVEQFYLKWIKLD